MGREETFHGVRIRLAGRRVDILSERQFVEVARIGDDENWSIIHPAPPFLAVGRDDADRHAFNPSHNIGSIRVSDRYGEPAHHGITARDQDGRDRISRSRSIGVEHTGEAYALGMIATMAERIPAPVAQSCNHPRRGQAVRSEPPARIRERKRRGDKTPPIRRSRPATAEGESGAWRVRFSWSDIRLRIEAK
jgi:hypothetical protein